jgi:Fur family zinc uptake transcriptional regulator
MFFKQHEGRQLQGSVVTELDLPARRKLSRRTLKVLKVAARVCRQKEARLTEIRLAVLEILSETNQPLGAYELLSRLESRLRRTFRAPTIYRALEFLGDLGLVDRIESRNAFVLAGDLERPHCSVFFLCNRCNTSVAVEDPGIALLIAENAATLGFQVTKPIIECNGICAGCAGAKTSGDSI